MNHGPLTAATAAALGAGARLYLQPACFVDRPHGLDGRVARLADSMLWFAAWQVWARVPGTRAQSALVPVEALEDWLSALPDDLARQGAVQAAAVQAPRAPLQLGERTIRFTEPQIMGILNVTPDSFSDGGAHADPHRAVEAGVAMAAAGAAIIDVGGESTRPGAKLVWEGDEKERVVPVVERLVRGGHAVSVDTRKAGVMEAALAAGAQLINDVSALRFDERSAEVVARSGAAVVLMHAPSASSDPHADAHYADVLFDVFDFLADAVARAQATGIVRDRLLVDPGIGFGKGVEDNLRLINGLALFQALGVPVMLGASRKRMIGALDGEAAADKRLGGSIALALAGAEAGAQVTRVHDVFETRQALRIWRGRRDTALTRI